MAGFHFLAFPSFVSNTEPIIKDLETTFSNTYYVTESLHKTISTRYIGLEIDDIQEMSRTAQPDISSVRPPFGFVEVLPAVVCLFDPCT